MCASAHRAIESPGLCKPILRLENIRGKEPYMKSHLYILEEYQNRCSDLVWISY